MHKYTSVPAITGKKLMKLLKKDGWQFAGKRRHGISLTKQAGERNLVTIIPNTRDSLPDGTLNKILSQQQTKLGREGLLNLLNIYGL